MKTNTVLSELNQLIQIFAEEIDYSSFILSIWIKQCYSQYPSNTHALKLIRNYYTNDIKKKSIPQIIDIINALKLNCYKFKSLCSGYLRETTKHPIIPNDIINIIDNFCIIDCIQSFLTQSVILLTDIISNTNHDIQCFIDNGIIHLFVKIFNRLNFMTKCYAIQALYNIAIKYPKLQHQMLTTSILKCTRNIQNFLSKTIPPTEQIILCNIIPTFNALAQFSTHPELQYVSLGVLLNIAAGPSDCTAYIIQQQTHLVLIQLLQSPIYEIKEQSLWGLANIAGDGQKSKDLLLNNDILSKIYSICSLEFDKQYVTYFTKVRVSRNPISRFMCLLHTAAWALSNLCRRTPSMRYLDLLIQCLQCLLDRAAFIPYEHDRIGKEPNHKEEMFVNVAWAFYYLTSYDRLAEYLMEMMFQRGIIGKIVDLMEHKSSLVRHPINRVIGNILTGSDVATKRLLHLGILRQYHDVLTAKTTKDKERIEICWSISNICIGPYEDKLLVLKHKLFQVLIDLLKTAPYKVGEEALWAIGNAVTENNVVIVNALIEMNVIDSVQSFLRKEHKCNKIVLIGLELFENILTVEPDRFSELFKEKGIIEYIKELKESKTGDDVDDSATRLLDMLDLS